LTGIELLKQRLSLDQVREVIAGQSLPLHLYFTDVIASNADDFRAVQQEGYPNSQIMFAVKSNPCMGAVSTAHRLGLGIDAVSEFELRAALEMGIPGAKIVCNGNAKTDDFLALAITNSATIAADSLEELDLISLEATAQRKTARALIRLSGMALDGLTSTDQSTAASWTKFGIPVGRWREAFNLSKSLPGVDLVGISAHIGTQICDASGYERLMGSLVEVVEKAFEAGWKMEAVDIGGGYPLSYIEADDWEEFQASLWRQKTGSLPHSVWITWGDIEMGFKSPRERAVIRPAWNGKAYSSRFPGAEMLSHLLEYRLPDGRTVAEHLKAAGRPQLLIEPGRALMGSAGITLAEVMGVKQVEENTLVIVNLGIVNHGTVLVTPDIYPMWVYPELPDDVGVEVFVAGRLCFTGDMISKVKIRLNRLPKRGDILAIGMTGAYSADHFASNSCGFPKPAKIAFHPDGSTEVWRSAEAYSDVFINH
jgi:diaminopimelate decarboxylase